MKASAKGIGLIKQFEGCRLKAYQDSVGVWTIGYGTTRYLNGDRVKEGDTITQEQAENLLHIDLRRRAEALGMLPVNQNQLDAILSFVYNVGIGAFNKSTLRKKIFQNPFDPSIAQEFARWNKAGGKVLNGLTKRRKAESDLYFS